MTELYLYQLIENILKASDSVQGRFFVAEGYGNDVNANNYDNIIKDALSSLKIENKKYPIAVLMPPVDQETPKQNGWYNYSLKLFFITLNGQDQNGIKNVDFALNVSQQQIYEDWSAMRIIAGDFREAFNLVTKGKSLLGSVRESQTVPAQYERYSKMNNDGCNGVSINMAVQLFRGCEITDYPEGFINDVVLPV